MIFSNGNARIGYDDAGHRAGRGAGDGRALLLLHAFPLDRTLWDPQFGRLAERVRTIRFDARGFGESAPIAGALRMETIAEDAEALLDHLGIESAVLCGLSMGGYAALAFARSSPERLAGLILADTRAGTDTPEARANRAALAERVERDGTGAAADALLPGLLGPTARSRHPDLVAHVRTIILRAAPGAIRSALEGLAARADAHDVLPRIDVPALVICGAEDTLTPPADAAELVAGLRASRMAVLPEAGHLSNLEAAEAFTSELADFMDEIGPDRDP